MDKQELINVAWRMLFSGLYAGVAALLASQAWNTTVFIAAGTAAVRGALEVVMSFADSNRGPVVRSQRATAQSSVSKWRNRL